MSQNPSPLPGSLCCPKEGRRTASLRQTAAFSLQSQHFSTAAVSCGSGPQLLVFFSVRVAQINLPPCAGRPGGCTAGTACRLFPACMWRGREHVLDSHRGWGEMHAVSLRQLQWQRTRAAAAASVGRPRAQWQSTCAQYAPGSRLHLQSRDSGLRVLGKTFYCLRPWRHAASQSG